MFKERSLKFGRTAQTLMISTVAASKGIAADRIDIAAKRGWHDEAAMFRAAQGAVVGASGFVIPDGVASAIFGDIPRDSLTAELAQAARPMTSFHSRMLVTDSEQLVATQVFEGQAIPCAGLAASSILVEPEKVAIIIPYSEEVVRDSDAAAVIESDTTLALQRGFDAVICAALAPGSAGGIAATADALADLRKVFAALSLTGTAKPIFAASVDTGILMATLRQGGVYVFPEMSPGGGYVTNCPAYVNDRLAAETLLAINPEAVAFKVGAIEVATSRNTSLEMSTSPTQNAATGQGAQLTSMFQNYAIALRIEVSFALAILRGQHVSEELTGIGWANS